MHKIEDIHRVSQIQALVASLVKKPNHLSLRWLEEHNWVAILLEDNLYYPSAEWIADAANAYGYDSGVALSLELHEDPIAYVIEFTQQDLLDFSRRFSLSNFVLVPIDLTFALLKEGGNYCIIAGPQDFVRKAIGYSFQTAWFVFQDYANDISWPDKHREFLHNVMERYRRFYPDGATIQV